MQLKHLEEYLQSVEALLESSKGMRSDLADTLRDWHAERATWREEKKKLLFDLEGKQARIDHLESLLDEQVPVAGSPPRNSKDSNTEMSAQEMCQKIWFGMEQDNLKVWLKHINHPYTEFSNGRIVFEIRGAQQEYHKFLSTVEIISFAAGGILFTHPVFKEKLGKDKIKISYTPEFLESESYLLYIPKRQAEWRLKKLAEKEQKAREKRERANGDKSIFEEKKSLDNYNSDDFNDVPV